MIATEKSTFMKGNMKKLILSILIIFCFNNHILSQNSSKTIANKAYKDFKKSGGTNEHWAKYKDEIISRYEEKIYSEKQSRLELARNKLNKTKRSEEKIIVNKTPFDKGPSYEGCQNENNVIAQECTSRKLAQFIIENFKINLIKISKYKIIDMNLFFKINKSGKIIDVKIKSNIDESQLHNNVKNEISRILSSVHNLNPAIYRGQITTAYYSLPVKINLN